MSLARPSRPGRGGRARIVRIAWVLTALLVLSPVTRLQIARSEDARSPAPLKVWLETRLRHTWIEARGALPTPAPRELRAVIRRGQETALGQPVAAADSGALAFELLLPGRLLPGAYEVEVLGAGSVVATGTLVEGTPEEIEPARERLRDWLRRARAALRDLACLVERHGRYHRAQLASGTARDGGTEGSGRPPAVLAEAQRAAWLDALERLRAQLRAARMDFSDYEREVILSPFAEATAALSRLFQAIPARRDELESAMAATARGQPSERLEPPTAILELARASATALGLPVDGAESDLWAWDQSAFGTPEGETTRTHSPLGYSIAVTPGWSVADVRSSSTDDPLNRLHLNGPAGAVAVVRVRDFPDARSFAELARGLFAQAREDWGASAYQPLVEALLPDGRSHRIDAVLAVAEPKRLVVVSRGCDDGRRLAQLFVVIPLADWEREKDAVEELAASFSFDHELHPELAGKRE